MSGENKMECKLHNNVSDADREFLLEKLWEYNYSRIERGEVGEHQSRPLDIIIRDGNGTICAGLVGNIRWKCFEVRIVWVAPHLRGCGYGTKLMETAESTVQRMGCGCILVDTFDFQSPQFYKKLDFELMGVLENPQTNHKRYYFKKVLKKIRRPRSEFNAESLTENATKAARLCLQQLAESRPHEP